jgi:hypothetical protein
MAYTTKQKRLLEAYKTDLGVVLKGGALSEIPSSLLLESIASFPEKYRQEIKSALNAGMEQAKYLRAKKVADSLKEGEEKRLETIGAFLKKYHK